MYEEPERKEEKTLYNLVRKLNPTTKANRTRTSAYLRAVTAQIIKNRPSPNSFQGTQFKYWGRKSSFHTVKLKRSARL